MSKQISITTKKVNHNPDAPVLTLKRGGEGKPQSEMLQIAFDDVNQITDLIEYLYLRQDQLRQEAQNLRILQPDDYQQQLQQVIQTLNRQQRHKTEEVQDLNAFVENLLTTATHLAQDVTGIIEHITKIYDDVHQLQEMVEVVTDRVIQLREIPVRELFKAVTTNIQQWVIETEREVEVIWEGEDIYFDKMILDALHDPLSHLVQNSIFHGIEPSSTRQNLNKPPQGTIYLTAFCEGDTIVLSVEDDGRGIDRDILLQKALQDGILSEENGQKLSNDDILQLIYLPGMSFGNESHKGVGLYYVRNQLNCLRGMIEIDTEVDHGTCFTLTIPRSSWTTVLLVQVGSETVGIESEFLLEVLHVSKRNIQHLADQEVLTIAEEIIPLIRLRDIWGFAAKKTDLEPVVLVGVGEKRIGLVVDGWQQQHRLIVKSAGSFLETLGLVAGFGMISMTDIVMLIDIPELMARCSIP